MLGLGKPASIEYGKKRGEIIVRGWKTWGQGFLLTEKPGASLPPLVPGQEAVIRMEHKGILFGIAVTYRENLAKTDLCIFSFHDDVIAKSLRENERIACLIPAAIDYSDSKASDRESVLIIDLGRMGIRFVTRLPVHASPNDELFISFYAEAKVDKQKIRLMRISGQGGRIEYAAQFVEMSPERLKLLDDYFAFCKVWAI